MVTKKKERNPNSGSKQSFVVSKIKAKMNNTSSFFKVSLKGNNKALAKALADQTEKTRQLVQEIVLLRQRIYALHFDLSTQRHQKKQMFSILQKFYNTFYKGLVQATNLIEGGNEGDLGSFCEDAEADHPEDVIPGRMFGSFLQAHDKPPRESKTVSQRASWLNINSEQELHPPDDDLRKSISSFTPSVCLVPMRLSSVQSQHSAKQAVHQKTLVCSTDMEITVVDSAAPIVTVDTKTSSLPPPPPPPSSEDTEGGKEISRPTVVEEASVAVAFSERQGTSSEVKLNIDNTNADVEPALGTGVGETDHVAPCRKTHVTSRRNSRLTLTSHNSNRDLLKIPKLRRTYIIPPKPFSDLVSEKQDGVSKPNNGTVLEENTPVKENATEMQHNKKMDELWQRQNNNSVNRKTYVISDRVVVKRSQKANDLAEPTDKDADSVAVMDTTYDAQQGEMFIGPTLTKNTAKKSKTLESLSTANKSVNVKRREKSSLLGPGRGRSTDRKTSSFDTWCDFFTEQDQQEKDIRVISTLQDPNSSHADIATENQENCDEEAIDRRKVSSEAPKLVKPWKISDFLADENPPWESLDFGDPFMVDSPASSPPSRQPSKAMEIYQEASPTMPSQSPEGRAMKSLTNTNCTTDAESGRSRRRGAHVSYKEPPLNAKMRRGDKFSDTQFLSSPVYKMKKTKKKKLKA